MSHNNSGVSLGPENIHGYNSNNYNINNNSSTRSGSSNNSSTADYSHIWVNIDVIGDGNCFYRSLYHAALFHVDPTAFKRLLLCFCLNVDDYDNEDTLKEFVKASAKSKRAPKQLAFEHKFCNAARAALANEIKYKDLFKRMDNAGSEDYKSPYAILKEKAELGQDIWEAITEEFSAGFKETFEEVSTFTDMSEGKFASTYADIVRTDREFVSQLEILMVNFMLRHCGLKIHTLNPDGKYRANDIGTLNASIKGTVEEMKLTPLFLMRLPEHYNFVVPSSIYEKHFAVLDNIGISDPEQHTDEDLFVNPEAVHAYIIKMTAHAGGRRRRATRHSRRDRSRRRANRNKATRRRQ